MASTGKISQESQVLATEAGLPGRVGQLLVVVVGRPGVLAAGLLGLGGLAVWALVGLGLGVVVLAVVPELALPDAVELARGLVLLFAARHHLCYNSYNT